MAASKKKSSGGKRSTGAKTGGTQAGRSRGGKVSAAKRSVSLSAEDRKYLSKTLSSAKSKVGELASGMNAAAVLEALEGFGLTSARVARLRGAIEDINVRDSVERASDYLGEQIDNAREYARENPRKVIGGAAGVLVGASLLAIALRRAGGGKKSSRKRSSSKQPSSGSKKQSTGGAKKSSKKR